MANRFQGPDLGSSDDGGENGEARAARDRPRRKRTADRLTFSAARGSAPASGSCLRSIVRSALNRRPAPRPGRRRAPLRRKPGPLTVIGSHHRDRSERTQEPVGLRIAQCRDGCARPSPLRRGRRRHRGNGRIRTTVNGSGVTGQALPSARDARRGARHGIGPGGLALRQSRRERRPDRGLRGAGSGFGLTGRPHAVREAAADGRARSPRVGLRPHLVKRRVHHGAAFPARERARLNGLKRKDLSPMRVGRNCPPLQIVPCPVALRRQIGGIVGLAGKLCPTRSATAIPSCSMAAAFSDCWSSAHGREAQRLQHRGGRPETRSSAPKPRRSLASIVSKP